MGKFIGRKVSVGFGKEATRGTGVAPTFWMPHTDLGINDTVTRVEIESSLGNIQQGHQAHIVNSMAEGDLGGEVRDESFGILLSALLGTASATGPVDEAYTHSFSILDSSESPALTMTVVDSNKTQRNRYCMLDSLELSQDLEEVLRFTASFRGRKSQDSSGTVSVSDESKFTKKHFRLALADEVGDLDSASGLSIRSFSMNIAKNLETSDALGTAEPEDFSNTSFQVTGNMTLEYEDETWKNYQANGTYKSMQVMWTNTDQTIGAGDTNPVLEFQLPKVQFFDWSPNYGLNDIVTQDVSFTAYYDLANTLDMISTCELINGHDGSDY